MPVPADATDHHTPSPVCVTQFGTRGGLLVKTDRLFDKKLVPMPPATLKDPTTSVYYDFLSGTTWLQAAKLLEGPKGNKNKKALINIGGYSGLFVLILYRKSTSFIFCQVCTSSPPPRLGLTEVASKSRLSLE